MEDRQRRLEAKVVPLKRAAIWCKRFGWIGWALAIVCMLVGTAGIFELLNSGDVATLVDYEAWEATEVYWTEMILYIIGAWWLSRLSEAFSAIVDVIGELSETV